MFSLSTFSSKKHTQTLVHLRNIQKDVTVSSDRDRRIQKSCFREVRIGLSKQFDTNKTFATFGQSGLSKSDVEDKLHDF